MGQNGGQKEKAFVAEVLGGHPPLPCEACREKMEGSPMLPGPYPSSLLAPFSLPKQSVPLTKASLSFPLWNLAAIKTQEHSESIRPS